MTNHRVLAHQRSIDGNKPQVQQTGGEGEVSTPAARHLGEIYQGDSSDSGTGNGSNQGNNHLVDFFRGVKTGEIRALTEERQAPIFNADSPAQYYPINGRDGRSQYALKSRSEGMRSEFGDWRVWKNPANAKFSPLSGKSITFTGEDGTEDMGVSLRDSPEVVATNTSAAPDWIDQIQSNFRRDYVNTGNPRPDRLQAYQLQASIRV